MTTKAAAENTKDKSVSEERLLDTEEASQYLGVKPRFLSMSRTKGEGPSYVKFARAVRYRMCDLNAYISERVRTSTKS